MGVQCYELYGGIALKNHAFLSLMLAILDMSIVLHNVSDKFLLLIL